MGSQCSFKLEPGKEDLWTLSLNSSYRFDNDSRLIYIHYNLTEHLLKTQFCKSPWIKFKVELLMAIVLFYSIFIVIGSLGNGLVCYVVLANRHMRTPRNLLILNLATSDLILCLFTQPFNLLKIATNAWRLGAFMCKMVPTTSAVNVYVSTFSIIAIALDRFRLIVRPTDRDFLIQPVWSVAVLASIWVLAFIFASPMIAFNSLEHFRLPRWFCIQEVCLEVQAYTIYKSAYSVVTMLIQYIFPIFVLLIAHYRIINRLKQRVKTKENYKIKHTPQSNIEEIQLVKKPHQKVFLGRLGAYFGKTANGGISKTAQLAVVESLQTNNASKMDSKTLPVYETTSNREENISIYINHTADCDVLRQLKSNDKHVRLQTPAEELSSVTGRVLESPSIIVSENKKLKEINEIREFDIQAEEIDDKKSNKNSFCSKDLTKKLWSLNSVKRKDRQPQTPKSFKACRKKISREKRINRLLISIALVFAASWMPLTVLNIVSDVMTGAVEAIDPKGLLNALCHLFVLVSACVNPVLYGWLNENFQREFKRLLCRSVPARATHSPKMSLTTINVG